jgi:hypothetical protein
MARRGCDAPVPKLSVPNRDRGKKAGRGGRKRGVKKQVGWWGKRRAGDAAAIAHRFKTIEERRKGEQGMCVCVLGGVHGQDGAEMVGVERADSALVRLGAAADAGAGRV